MKQTSLVNVLALAAFLLAVTSAPRLAVSETPFVIKDINSGGASAPSNLVTMNGVTFFAADDGANGVELWKSDGTQAGTVMVKDICVGTCSSWPGDLTVATLPSGQFLFFSAGTTAQGYELWKSDGTTGGTAIVADIIPGSGSSGVDQITAIGSQVFFTCAGGTTGFELWKSDGTAGGTELVKDIAPGYFHSSPTYLTDLDGTLFFSALSSDGRELWKSNGTEGGTVMVKDISPGSGNSNPGKLTAVGGTLFFVAISGSGYELWKSDGSASGTTQVKNINPGFESSHPDHLTPHDNELYFAADDGSDGVELWKSDGTFAGTVKVRDINGGSASSNPAQLAVVGDTLFFTADDGSTGSELWTSDGTFAGTSRVRDIYPGAPSSDISELTPVGNSVYFSADDGSIGRELWRSDGTFAGTEFWNINAEEAPSTPTQPTPSAGLVVFAADDGVIGRELWALLSSGPVLGLTKVFADDFVEVDSAGNTFTLTVSNTGNAAANSVRVTDSVDSRLTIVSVSPAPECDASFGQFVDCTFPTLNPAGVETITVTYSVPSGAALGEVVNLAQAGEFGGPLVEASDSVEIVEPCEGDAHLDITQENIYSTYYAEACVSISVGPTVNVMPGADATFSAGESVVLNDGFVVESGASLTVVAN